MNLFDISTWSDAAKSRAKDKPRGATAREAETYLIWLAERAGLTVAGMQHYADQQGLTVGQISPVRYEGSERIEATYHAGAFCIPMPGYGRRDVVTCDILDDQGEVARTVQLPAKPNGDLSFDKADMVKWSGVQPVKAPRAKAKAKPAPLPPVETAPRAPVAADHNPFWVEATEREVISLREAVTALQAQMANAIAAPSIAAARINIPVAANDAGRAVRSAREERLIRTAWAMRAQMRQRADLDRRALLQVNGDNRLMLETLQRAEAAERDARQQIGEALDLAQSYLDDLTRTEARVAELAESEACLIETVALRWTAVEQQTQRADEAERRASAADRTIGRLTVEVRAMQARAERLARIAQRQKRDAVRMDQDLRGARAESRAFQRRYEQVQDALAASPAAAAVVQRKLVVAA